LVKQKVGKIGKLTKHHVGKMGRAGLLKYKVMKEQVGLMT